MTNNCKIWSGFIQTNQPVQSEKILKSIENYKSENCLFVIIDKENDDVIDSQFPTSKTIESRLISETSVEIIHLKLSTNNQPEIESSTRVKSIELGAKMWEITKRASEEIGEYFGECLREFAAKLVLNAISTGAHVLIGKTYENIMIDVRVSNVKLYYRALGILRRLSGASESDCEQALLTTIYGENSSQRPTAIEDHVENVSAMQLVVPTALFMLLAKCSLNIARDALYSSRNSVRNCIFVLKNQQK
jgi:hypothetical protein